MKLLTQSIVNCTAINFFFVFSAAFASLRSILLVELLGLEKLTNAFGLLLLFQGIAALVGSPVAGMIPIIFFFELSGNFQVMQITIKLFFFGIILSSKERKAKWRKKKKQKQGENGKYMGGND